MALLFVGSRIQSVQGTVKRAILTRSQVIVSAQVHGRPRCTPQRRTRAAGLAGLQTPDMNLASSWGRAWGANSTHRGLVRLRLGFLVLVRHLGVALKVVEQRHSEGVAAVQLVPVGLVPRRKCLLQRCRTVSMV